MIQEAREARFSWITGVGTNKPVAPHDVEIAGNEHFAVIPSIGSLVPGWLLVVPRTPRLNLSGLDARVQQSLMTLVTEVSGRLKVFGEDVYCFEHGSSFMGSPAGCGVDQAHLHIVPLPFDLAGAAAAEQKISWSPLSLSSNPLTQLPAGEEYIAVWRQSDSSGVIGRPNTPTSQWVRRLIADKLGVGDEWNYRSHPQTEIISTTLARLKVTPKLM